MEFGIFYIGIYSFGKKISAIIQRALPPPHASIVSKLEPVSYTHLRAHETN
jgi:hypothetical protein